MSDTEYRPKWENRRQAIRLTLIFCAAIIIYCVGWGEKDNSLHKYALEYAFMLGGITLFSYVGWAAWDDKNVMEMMKR